LAVEVRGSTLLIVLGMVLLGVGVVYPFITLVVDTTPPDIAATCPENGRVYTSLTEINAWVGDPETDVVSVTCTINGQTYTLRKSHLTPYAIADTGGYALWEYDIPDITTGGTYSFTFRAKNKAGLTAEYSGTFTIYTALQGNWYVNNQPITSPTQTIYTTSPTVSFKFQKTAGVEDTKISCWVEEGGARILTLTLTDTANHIWTGTYTFTPGTHTIKLVASDGTNTVTFSIIGLTIQGVGGWTLTTQQTLMLIGAIAIVAGVTLRIKGK